MVKKYSLLFPKDGATYKIINPIVMHDLGLDAVCKLLSAKESEQNLIQNILAKTTDDYYVIKYRCDIFEDIINNREIREELLAILDRINFLKNYGGFNRAFDENSNIWDLMHRLDELNDYIRCVDSIYNCLIDKNIKSDGLKGLRDYVEEIYNDNGFGQLKEDISRINLDTSNLKSLTIGINLNERFEAEGIGLVSINSKHFTKSNVISNFCDHISSKNKINQDTNWDEEYRYHQLDSHDFSHLGDSFLKIGTFTAAKSNPLLATAAVASVAEGDATRGVPYYMDRVVNQMISGMVKKIKEVLNMYVTVTITNMTDLIPELLYYVKWAEFIEKHTARGAIFSKPTVINSDGDVTDGHFVKAKDIYNIKLVLSDESKSEDIVTNDFGFDSDHRMYILTGANRGGKTTITQAVGQLFVLAQGGIYIPGNCFEFSPVDCVYTHFPADEDKTFDLGRLGEECKRFKEIFGEATSKSLILMNETFSTTSFEEGYYIARDSVRALLVKGTRTIYNTHMHKLAYDVDEINREAEGKAGMAYSLIVHNEGENRSYKIEVAPPVGKSFAAEIARKYGVTYDMLLN